MKIYRDSIESPSLSLSLLLDGHGLLSGLELLLAALDRAAELGEADAAVAALVARAEDALGLIRRNVLHHLKETESGGGLHECKASVLMQRLSYLIRLRLSYPIRSPGIE